MRIGVDIRCLSEQQPGGVPRYTRQLLDHLLRLDQQNEYVLFSNSWSRSGPSLKEISARRKITHWPNKLHNSCLACFHRPQLDRVIGPVDLFFVPNINFVSLSKGCPLVLTVHDLSFEIYPHFLNLKRKLWHRAVSPRRLARRADAIIAVSQQTKRDLVDLYDIPAGKITVIYSGIDEEFLLDDAEEDINKTLRNYNIEKPYVLSISFLEPRKNLIALLHAFKRFKKLSPLPHKLLIIGAAGWQYDKLQKAIKQLSCEKDIRLLGYLPDKEKRIILRAADLFVYPSVYEGFGFPPLESLAAGTPVIASAAPALPEVLRDTAILVQPYNIIELSEALLTAAGNKEIRRKLLEHRHEIIELYSWQRSAEQTRDLFNKTILNAHRH